MTDLLLYQNKHRFRSMIELVRKDSVAPNFSTGRRAVNQTVYPLDAVVEVTNNWLTRTFNRTDVNANNKGWLIDPRDLPEGIEPRQSDTIQDYGVHSTVDNPKLIGVYEVVTVDVVQGGILVVGLRTLVEGQRSAVISPSAIDDLPLADEQTGGGL